MEYWLLHSHLACYASQVSSKHMQCSCFEHRVWWPNSFASEKLRHHQVDSLVVWRVPYFLLLVLVFLEHQSCGQFSNIPVRRCALLLRREVHVWGVYKILRRRYWTVFRRWTFMVRIQWVPLKASWNWRKTGFLRVDDLPVLLTWNGWAFCCLMSILKQKQENGSL